MDALQKQRQFVTVRGIRDTIGAGSFSTISKYLKKIDEERKASLPLDQRVSDQRMRILSKLLADIGTSVELAQEMSRDSLAPNESARKLTRLCYRSRSVDDVSDSDLLKILKESQYNNKRYEITGCLLYSNREFLQIIEGNASRVMSLYQDISEDSRNYDNEVILLSQDSQRFFENWSMVCYKPSRDTFVSYCKNIFAIKSVTSHIDRNMKYKDLFSQLKKTIEQDIENLLISI